MGFAKNLTYPSVILAFGAFNLLLALAIMARPDFALFTNYLSDLGVGESAIYFNSACIIAGLLLVLIFYGFHEMSWRAHMCTLGCALGMLSGIALMGVGVFPETHEWHFPVSASYFILAALSIATYTMNHVTRHGPLDILLAIGAVHFILSALLAYSAISDASNTPFYETATVFVFEIWVLAAAIHHQKRRKE
jgi:hypothetical membrane protein